MAKIPPIYAAEDASMDDFIRARDGLRKANSTARGINVGTATFDDYARVADQGKTSIPKATPSNIGAPSSTTAFKDYASMKPKGDWRTNPNLRMSTPKSIPGANFAAKRLPLIGTAVEAYDASGDLADAGDAWMQTARVGESAAKLALGTIGGVLGSAGGPLGTVAGGAAGYEALPMAEKGVRALGGPSFLPSTIIEEQRQAKAGSEAAAAAAGVRAKQTEEQKLAQEAGMRGAVERGQQLATQQFPDQVGRAAQSRGVVTPSSPAVPKLPSRDSNAYDVNAAPGTGYLSGTDADGVRRFITAEPPSNANVVPSGAIGAFLPGAKSPLDRQGPSTLAEADANLRSALESAASGKFGAERAMAAKAELEKLRVSDAARAAEDQAINSNRKVAALEMNIRQAQHDREIAVGRKDSAMFKDASYRALESARLLKNFQDNEVETNRTKTAAESTKYRDDLGLRGQVYQADRQYEGDKLKATATLQAAQAKADVDLNKYKDGLMEKNREGFSKWERETFVTDVLNKDGQKTGTTFDQKAATDFQKFVFVNAAQNPELLKRLGVEKVDDLTTTHWRQLHDAYTRARSITNNANSAADSGDQKLNGMPQDLRVRVDKTKAGDWFDWDSGNTQNSITLGESLRGAANIFAGDMGDLTITLADKDGKAQKRMLRDVVKTPEDMTRVIEMLRSQGDVKTAKQLQDRFNQPVAGLRK